MATKPHPWPSKAKGARDRAAEAAVASLLAMRPLITGKLITDTETLRSLAVITQNLDFIKSTLEAVGAQTKVDPDFWTLPKGVLNGR